MIVRMTLLSDAVFGNGMSVPGAEDISVLFDEYGFPYFRGTTFKGIFREELERLLGFSGLAGKEAQAKVAELLGEAGDDEKEDGRMRFSDFTIPLDTKKKVLEGISGLKAARTAGGGSGLTGRGAISSAGIKEEIIAATTNIRTFTAMDDDGNVKKGSLRMARCVDKGLSFYSRIECPDEDEEIVSETFGLIKWVGTMRNRGFGRVKLCIVPEAE